MTSKQKIINYLAFKEISQRKFSLKTGLSEGILRAGKHLGVDKMETIRAHYPDLNMNWVIFGDGEMLLEEINEPAIEYEHLKSEGEKLLKKFVITCVREYMEVENRKKAMEAARQEARRKAKEKPKEEPKKDLRDIDKYIIP